MSVGTRSKTPSLYTQSIERRRIRDVVSAGPATASTRRRVHPTLCHGGYPNQCVGEPVPGVCSVDIVVGCQICSVASLVAELGTEVTG
ncbi:MAG: hypothetical protein A07HR60_00147 [uncultured archaeon A07HR60]|nr:MAG: hypothetical protein J07HR59_00646 [Halorubrum sp. J07HR59]ESS12913.1 MAG: hypothetical protein A07HR60_00147 [uncultured archaeon A07HR60]